MIPPIFSHKCLDDYYVFLEAEHSKSITYCLFQLLLMIFTEISYLQIECYVFCNITEFQFLDLENDLLLFCANLNFQVFDELVCINIFHNHKIDFFVSPFLN